LPTAKSKKPSNNISITSTSPKSSSNKRPKWTYQDIATPAPNDISTSLTSAKRRRTQRVNIFPAGNVELSAIVEDQDVLSNAEVSKHCKVPIYNMTLSKELVGNPDSSTLGNDQPIVLSSHLIDIRGIHTDSEICLNSDSLIRKGFE
jgi:hypothetical protein